MDNFTSFEVDFEFCGSDDQSNMILVFPSISTVMELEMFLTSVFHGWQVPTGI